VSVIHCINPYLLLSLLGPENVEGVRNVIRHF
jgi:hypothetical protein